MSLLPLQDPEVFIDYFEQIARSNKNIMHSDKECHFYPFDTEELDTNFRNSIRYPALVLEYPESFISGEGANVMETIRGAFWITTGFVNPNDYGQIKKALKESKKLGYQVLSKLKKDNSERIILGFDIHKVNMQKVGPILDELYFYRFEFQLLAPVGGEFCFCEEEWG